MSDKEFEGYYRLFSDAKEQGISMTAPKNATKVKKNWPYWYPDPSFAAFGSQNFEKKI